MPLQNLEKFALGSAQEILRIHTADFTLQPPKSIGGESEAGLNQPTVACAKALIYSPPTPDREPRISAAKQSSAPAKRDICAREKEHNPNSLRLPTKSPRTHW